MLEVRDLDVAYGAAPALWNVSIDVRRGELLCVVGPNGAGKTTLINTIAGLNRAHGGRLSLDGVELTRLAPHKFCGCGIAIVPEGRRLFTQMSVRENLELGSFVRAARAHRVASLDAVLTLFPVLKTRLESRAGELSGGQQQMVAIARALMARPKLLLLDEPSLGLSPAIVEVMFDAIRQINADGMTVMLVEQNVAMALDVSTRAYVLEEGRIVAEGEPRELVSQPHIQKAYLGH